MNDNPQTILFVSLSCVGDAVMTTPVLQALHDRYPDAVIDIVSDARSDIIYSHCPYRGEVYLKNKKKFLRGAPQLLSRVRRRYYDLIVDLRTDGLAYLFRGDRRITKWGKRPYGPHAVQALMGVIREIHGERPVPPAKVWLGADEMAFASEKLSGLPEGRWLALVPGNANPRKVWPATDYAALANGLKDRVAGVILDGSPRERTSTGAVSEQLQLPCIDLAGSTNLLQSAAVLARAALFIGSDSGPGHIAAAMGTPTLTLFSVDRPERVLPWGDRSEALISPDDQACNIPLANVMEKARTMLD